MSVTYTVLSDDRNRPRHKTSTLRTANPSKCPSRASAARLVVFRGGATPQGERGETGAGRAPPAPKARLVRARIAPRRRCGSNRSAGANNQSIHIRTRLSGTSPCAGRSPRGQ